MSRIAPIAAAWIPTDTQNDRPKRDSLCWNSKRISPSPAPGARLSAGGGGGAAFGVLDMDAVELIVSNDDSRRKLQNRYLDRTSCATERPTLCVGNPINAMSTSRD